MELFYGKFRKQVGLRLLFFQNPLHWTIFGHYMAGDVLPEIIETVIMRSNIYGQKDPLYEAIIEVSHEYSNFTSR